MNRYMICDDNSIYDKQKDIVIHNIEEFVNQQDDKIKESEILVEEYYNAVKAHEDGKLEFCKKFNCCTLHQVEKKIRKLEKEIAELKQVKTKEPKIWRPEIGDIYFFINFYCNIEYRYWYTDDFSGFDTWNYLIGNCFKTKEEAEEYLEQRIKELKGDK